MGTTILSCQLLNLISGFDVNKYFICLEHFSNKLLIVASAQVIISMPIPA